MPRITFTVATQYTNRLHELVAKMRDQNRTRMAARDILRRKVIEGRRRAGLSALAKHLVDAEVEAQEEKDWLVRSADTAYSSTRQEVMVHALLELVELTRRSVEQQAQILHLLDDRIPRKIH